MRHRLLRLAGGLLTSPAAFLLAGLIDVGAGLLMLLRGSLTRRYHARRDVP